MTVPAATAPPNIAQKVVGIFKEDYTGKVLDRPELNKVREMFRAGQAEALISYKTNRLDRSEWGVNLLILLQELKSLGVELHYSQNRRQVDLNNPIEALMESISGCSEYKMAGFQSKSRGRVYADYRCGG